MKELSTYSKEEILELCSLFKQKDMASPDKQKGIRAKMRRRGFYITDYAKDMDFAGFMDLLQRKDIFIDSSKENGGSGGDSPSLQQPHEAPAILSGGYVKEGLDPWIDEHSKVLVLGTLPSDVSIKEQAYYRNYSHNSFWTVMHKIFGEGDETREFLLNHHVALWDCLRVAVRKGSQDKGFELGSEIPNDIFGLLRKNPQVKAILLNGKSASKFHTLWYFKKYFGNLCSIIPVVPLLSTSNTCSVVHDEKVSEWNAAIRKYLSY